jgi:thioredoxin-related protein
MKATIFTTEWCGPCKMMKSTYLYKLIDEGYNIQFVDVEEDLELAAQFDVTAVPKTVFFDENDNIVNEIVGFMPEVKFLQNME